MCGGVAVAHQISAARCRLIRGCIAVESELQSVADCSRAEDVIRLSTGWVVVQACCSVPSVGLGRVGGLLRVRLAIPGRTCTRIIDTSRSRVCVLEEIAQISTLVV